MAADCQPSEKLYQRRPGLNRVFVFTTREKSLKTKLSKDERHDLFQPYKRKLAIVLAGYDQLFEDIK